MPDDKTPQAPVEEQTPVEPEYTNEELQKESIREIAENTEIPTPKEEVKETPVAPVEPEVPQPTVEEITAKAAEEAERRVFEKLEEQRKVKEEEEKVKTPQENEYVTWEKQLWEKEKRQPTYTEALDFMGEQAEKRLEERQNEKLEADAEAKRVEQERASEESEKLNSYVDDELTDLYKAGKLTPIKDPNNPSDQGKVEREALFTKWGEVNAQRRQEGKPDILSATRIYEFYYQKPTVQPAGADAPVFGSQGSSVTPSGQQDYSYAEVHNTGWKGFFKRPTQ